MAKAITRIKEIEIPKTIIVKEQIFDGITLELDKAEAKLLHLILGKSHSGISFGIYNELNQILYKDNKFPPLEIRSLLLDINDNNGKILEYVRN